MGDMGDKLGGEYVFDRQYILTASESMGDQVFKLVSDLSVLSRRKNDELFSVFARIQHDIQEELAGRHAMSGVSLVLPLSEVTSDLGEATGSKLANVGDIKNILGLETPDGFVITAKAFFDFMDLNGITELVESRLAGWDGKDDKAFTAISDDIRNTIMNGKVPRPVRSAVSAALELLSKRSGRRRLRLALRSSAWGEDTESSFARITSYNVCYTKLLRVAHEQGDVLAPLAEQGKRHRDHVEPEEEVLAEAPEGDLVLEVLVGGGDDPDVQADGPCAAHAQDAAFLDDVQQLDLHARGHLADLVEEDRAARGGFEEADLGGGRNNFV